MTSTNKQVYKIGQMIIDQKQIFWKMQYCYALIPIVQIEDGHILVTTHRNVTNYTQLKPVQVFDLSLTISFLCKSLETFHGCTSSNIHIQNVSNNLKESGEIHNENENEHNLNQMIVHIIPRKSGDPKITESIYEQLEEYPATLIKHYNEKMNFYVNAYANKILEAIHEQSKKYESHLNMCFKEQKQN